MKPCPDTFPFPLYGLFELSAFFVKNDTNGDADDEDEDSTEIAPA